VSVGVTLDAYTANERNVIFEYLGVDEIELAISVLRIHDGPPLLFFRPSQDEIRSLPKWKPEFIPAKPENRNKRVQLSDRRP
jgi:hypothetical protein